MGQEPTVLAVGAGGVVWIFFSCLSFLVSFFLWETEILTLSQRAVKRKTTIINICLMENKKKSFLSYSYCICLTGIDFIPWGAFFSFLLFVNTYICFASLSMP